jgi:hypothetical protein
MVGDYLNWYFYIVFLDFITQSHRWHLKCFGGLQVLEPIPLTEFIFVMFQ